jgi:hypothetical protein
MRTIPASQLVQVNPGVLAASGTLSSLIGLVLTASTAVPIDQPKSFSTADDVGKFFGYTSDEYVKVAQVYFAGPTNATKAPSSLLFAQYPTANVAAYLRSAALGLTLDDLKLLSGTISVTIDGTANSSSNIDLSTATSFADAATIIQAAFTTPNFSVSYDAQRTAFVFTSSTTGASSSAGFAAAGSLATSLKLTQAAGAVVSQGAVAATPSAFMSGIHSIDATWALFTTVFEPDTADKTAFSAWTSLQDNTIAYVGWDSDPNAKASGNTTTWGYNVKQAGDSGSVLIYGDLTHAAFILSYAACLDFARLNGRATVAFMSQAGLVASVDNASDASALLANGYNFYGIYGVGSQQFNMFQNGSVSGEYLWLDSYLNQIWIRANLQLSLLALLMSAGSVPYNTDGYAMVSAACADPIQAALNYGAIRDGVLLSTSQAQQINQATGVEAASIVQATGYFLQVNPASPSARAARQTPPITLYYTDGQSIQNIVMAAIEIQ